jgi:hypothetical protein
MRRIPPAQRRLVHPTASRLFVERLRSDFSGIRRLFVQIAARF